MARTSPRPAPAAPIDAAQCAAEVIAVVPGIMDSLRASMRRNIGDGLSIPQFRCLGFISRHPGTSISEVAAFLGVTLATASAMVDRLVRAYYVVTATSAADRRRTELRLNAPGLALLEEIRVGAERDMSAALGPRSPAELATLMAGLAILAATFTHGAG